MGDTTHSRWSISAHENNTLPLQKKKIYIRLKLLMKRRNSKKLLNEKALNKK